MIFRAIAMPDPDILTVRVEKSNGDVITFCNSAHISAEMCAAISAVAQLLLDREVWQLRKLRRGYGVEMGWPVLLLSAVTGVLAGDPSWAVGT